MTRRERTTGIPRPRERATAVAGRTFLGMRWSDTHTRVAILGSIALLALVVLGLILYRWYDENYLMPGQRVLTVGDQTFDLDYFTERMPSYAQANPSLSPGFLEGALLAKLEDEAVTIILAEERGIDLSDEAITQWIADDLGVPPGGAGTSFDSLYRQRLRTLGLSNGDYRRLATASAADEALREQLKEERGETGAMFTLRVVSIPDSETADDILARIEGGEDMGTIAQTESNDLQSRQQDGLTEPTPVELFHEDVQAAIDGAEEDSLIGPVEVGDNFWVLRVERFQDDGTYSDTQRDQLARIDLNALIDEAKQRPGLIERDLSSDEIEWAYAHIDTG